MRSLVEEIDSCVIVFGYCLEYGRNLQVPYSKASSNLVSPEEYIFLCATRAFRTLRAIKYLLDKEAGTDALPLVRSVYECYLHIVFVKRHPEKLKDMVDAVLGLKSGTHEYALNRKGSINRRQIVDKITGETFEGHISAFRMISATGIDGDVELFDYLYEFLSEFTHPGFNNATDVVNEQGQVDPKLAGEPLDACIYAIVFSCLVLDEIRLLPTINNEVVEDIKTVTHRIAGKGVHVLQKHLNSDGADQFLSLLQKRLSVVATRLR